MNKIILFVIFLLLIITSCRDRDKKSTAVIKDAPLYFDYQVWGDDEKKDITILLRFRSESFENKAVALEPPSCVALDEKILKGDSSKMSGTYYEAVSTADSFAGVHSIIFTDKGGKKYKDEFSFHPFSLSSGLTDTVRRSNLTMHFQGLNEEDYIHVIAIDTSFRSRGINELDTLKNGKLVFNKQQFNNLVNGPVRIEFYKEEEIPVKNGTDAGGYILITYGVKKGFILVD
jgi:hypothetical protein